MLIATPYPQKTTGRDIRLCHARSSGAKNNEKNEFLG